MSPSTSLRLGRILGVEIELHYSWFLIALLLTFSLASHVRHVNPAWGHPLAWGTAIVGAALFFVALLAHELAHSLVAKARGMGVRSITLFALGGVSDIETEPTDAKSEFWMAIVGPITSFVIGAIALGLAAAIGWRPIDTPSSPTLVVLTWLGWINVALAVFNLIPGFPLDGGRVLRAFAWWATGDAALSTRVATRVGQVVAVGFMVFGIVRFFSGAGVHGLWMVFIGWFLLQAASASRTQLQMGEQLRSLTVTDLMATDYPIVEAATSLQAFVDEYLLRTGHRCFVVVDGGEALGLVTSQEVKGVDRARWPEVVIRDVMRPVASLRTIAAEAPAIEAFEALVRDDINQLAAMRGGRIVGLLSRGRLMRLLRARAEFAGGWRR